MNNFVKFSGTFRLWIMITVVTAAMLASATANAQVPPRFYWKTLQGTNAIPIIAMSTSGNTNPLDPSHHFDPAASLSADVAIAGFAKILPIGNKAGMLAVLVPMGRIEGAAKERHALRPIEGWGKARAAVHQLALVPARR